MYLMFIGELPPSFPITRVVSIGSMQHSGRSRFALKTKARSLARVRAAETLPWLGFDRVRPNRSLPPGKHCRINALDGVASTV
jgi:hypothetical protein